VGSLLVDIPIIAIESKYMAHLFIRQTTYRWPEH